MDILWTNEAVQDAEEIIRFLNEVNPQAAQNYANRFREFNKIVTFMPEIAQQWRANPQYRCWVIAPYKVIYRVNTDTDQVVVVTVIHGKRKSPSHLLP